MPLGGWGGTRVAMHLLRISARGLTDLSIRNPYLPPRLNVVTRLVRSTLDLEKLYPNNKAEQRYLCQVYCSNIPATITTPPQLCVVDPAYQRKGIASKLVQWDLDEAERRGGLEATTEASSMGRHVYGRLGFHGEGLDIEYYVDSEFIPRERPSNVFMRAGTSQ
ncbi:hypothetical protein K449DRAFT_460643 [Hypoxylon sp. EC38]|nr:hypothetical protein K449DRAFT_460643 [Hypoxylon sp. EC38]